MARKPGKTPRFAKSQIELGGYLTPPRDRKIIQQALKMDGNPGRARDGRYEIAEWQEFIKANFASIVDPGSGSSDKRNLEMEKLRLQNDKLKFELEVKRKDYTANTEIEQAVGQMVMETKRVLMRIPSKLAPVLPGMTDVEIEKRLRAELTEALELLAGDPLGLNAGK